MKKIDYLDKTVILNNCYICARIACGSKLTVVMINVDYNYLKNLDLSLNFCHLDNFGITLNFITKA